MMCLFNYYKFRQLLSIRIKNYRKICKMQNYQQFWHNKLSHLDSQLQLDFDTFIDVFSQQIYNQTNIKLTELQKHIIKCQIDPENKNQVYKNGYLLFVKNFWGIASQRTKFFNMKINLTKLKGQVQSLTQAGFIKIRVAYKYRADINQGSGEGHYQKVIDQFLIKQDKISLLSSTPNSPNANLYPKPVQIQEKGFIKLGSSQRNTIPIPIPSINQSHLKIIYSTNMHQEGKSSYSFTVQPKPLTQAFIRDISTSNRVKYVIDNQNNYFVVKKGMIFASIGLMQSLFQIVIDSVPPVELSELNTILDTLNQNRKSFIIGQSDKPLKVATNFNVDPINQTMIIDLYDRNLFYPTQNKLKSGSSMPSNGKQESKPPLKFRLINKRTLQQFKYESKGLKSIAIGRDKQKCQVLIDHISIRPIQFVFQMINQVWFVREFNSLGKNLGINTKQTFINPVISAYLTADMSRNSNRLPLSLKYPENFTIKNDVHINIQVVGADKIQQDDY